MPETGAGATNVGDFVRDRVWQFVGVLVALVALAFSIYMWRQQREVKSLQVVLLANSSVVEIEESVSADVEVLYRDNPIDNLSFLQLKVENDGNATIREEDFARPINLVFPSEAEIVDGGVLESDPPNIGTTVEWEQNIATLSPAMLNGGDRAIIKLLVINMPDRSDIDDIELDARIAGVNDIALRSAIEAEEPAELGRAGRTLSLAFGVFLLVIAVIGIIQISVDWVRQAWKRAIEQASSE
jgi:hypothetical protein